MNSPWLVVACIRCAVEHPDERATPLAILVDHPEHGIALLHNAIRVRTESPPRYRDEHASYVSSYESREPLSDRADQAVMVQCRRCSLKVGPISAKRVAALFAEGRADAGVLLLPLPAGTAR